MEAALTHLYERARGQLRAVAARYVGADAEDVVQDAFISALGSYGGFRGDASPHTWLHRIVVNRSLSLCRQRVTRAAAHVRRIHPPAIANASLHDAVAIRIAVGRLSRTEYQVFTMYHVMGLTHHEIASQLAIPVGTSKWRLFAARKRLQQLLS